MADKKIMNYDLIYSQKDTWSRLVKKSESGNWIGIKLLGQLTRFDALVGIATETKSPPLLAAAIPARIGAP